MQRNLPILLSVLIAIVLTLGSCTRSDSEEAAAAAPGDGGSSPQSEVPQGAAGGRAGGAAEGAVPMRLTDQGRARSEQPTVTPADPRDTGFEASRLIAVAFLPRDTVMGILGAGAGSARDRAILASCEALLVPLLSGELPTGVLSDSLGPGGRAVLDDLIWASDTLSEVRLGQVYSVTDYEAAVPFRLIGETRTATGEVILDSINDRWYTADIQVEFSARDTTSRFSPGAVRSNPNL